ncbi:hypothetical protein RND81_03G148000 [Saponaria officinalis]|uniref:Uncharacterized protein n=1 Tax=Saponaria officinalis TaxID=3572 RepID=A0AAW1M838_SAPOF
MAVESEKDLFLPDILKVNEDKKSHPNYYSYYYKPQFTNKVPLHLSCTKIPTHNLISTNNNPTHNLISTNNNPNYKISKIEKLNPGACPMEDEPIKVVRSVVAGFLLKRLDEFPTFPPINTKSILYYLKDDHLLSPFEKRALLEVSEEDEDEDEDETLISALNSALLSIEADTKAVKCWLVDNLNGEYKERVFVMSVQPDKLVNELLSISLHLEDLALSPDKLSNMEEQEKRKYGGAREKKKGVFKSSS